MALLNINIPFPALLMGETFHVVIVDSTDTIVSDTMQTNATFNVTLPSGDYRMTTDYNGAADVWCFTVFECECPIITDYRITTSDFIPVGGTAVKFLEISFDMSAGFGCAFELQYTDEASSTVLVINSLDDFTSHIGTTYTKKIHIYGSSVGFSILKLPSREICTPATYVSETCVGPTIPSFARRNAITNTGSIYRLDILYPDCGGTCHTININFSQIGVGLSTPDTGTFVQSLDCSFSYPFVMSMPINPDLSGGSSTNIQYIIEFIDCCGNRYTVPYYATNY